MDLHISVSLRMKHTSQLIRNSSSSLHTLTKVRYSFANLYVLFVNAWWPNILVLFVIGEPLSYCSHQLEQTWQQCRKVIYEWEGVVFACHDQHVQILLINITLLVDIQMWSGSRWMYCLILYIQVLKLVRDQRKELIANVVEAGETSVNTQGMKETLTIPSTQ